MKVVTEHQANLEITEQYLEENSREIHLTRHKRTKSGTGGYTTEEEPLPPQRFAIIGPTAGLRRAPEVAADIGMVASYNLSMVGDADADVRDNDTFELEGGRYRVDFVFPEHTYKTHAVIVYEGPIPDE